MCGFFFSQCVRASKKCSLQRPPTARGASLLATPFFSSEDLASPIVPNMLPTRRVANERGLRPAPVCDKGRVWLIWLCLQHRQRSEQGRLWRWGAFVCGFRPGSCIVTASGSAALIPAPQDRNETARLAEEGYAEELYEQIGQGDEIAKKGPRVAMSRFHSTHPVCEHLLPVWHSRLLLWLYMGINLGTVRTLSDCFSVVEHKAGARGKADPQEEGDKKETMQAGKQQENKRLDVKGTINVATHLLLDSTFHRKAIGGESG